LPMHQLNTCWVMEKLAIAYFEMSEMKMAQKAFEKVRELDPYYIDEGMAIFSTLLWLSRKESLLSSLAQDLVDCEKMSAPSWCAMANCFSLQKEHDLAIKFLKRAIQLQPDFVYAYTLLGHEYVFTEELDLALSCFRSALRYNERHYNAWYGIGMVYYKQEKFNLAEQHYKLAIKIHPKSSILLCHLAVTQHELGKHEQALETVHKAIELDPKNGLCKYQKARFLMSLDKVREALEELEQLKRIVPKDYLVYFLIGKAHQQLDEPHLAQMNFSWAMSLDPQGTNTTIKEAMNQQHYMSADHDFLDDITEDNAPDSLPGLSVEDDTMSD
jgi:anaphase-promoting complex subunit 3